MNKALVWIFMIFVSWLLFSAIGWLLYRSPEILVGTFVGVVAYRFFKDIVANRNKNKSGETTEV